MPRSMRSWSYNRDFTYSGFRLSQVKDILSNLGCCYTIDKITSPRNKDFEPNDNCRVAFTEKVNDIVIIYVSELQ